MRRYKKEGKVNIEVFITRKDHKFRCNINDKEKNERYSVTVGSIGWEGGKGREHEKDIKLLCLKILIKLQNEYKNIFKKEKIQHVN